MCALNGATSRKNVPPSLLTVGAGMQINLIAGGREGLREPEPRLSLQAHSTPRRVHLPSPDVSVSARGGRYNTRTRRVCCSDCSF